MSFEMADFIFGDTGAVYLGKEDLKYLFLEQ